jgi:hypothetical protein
MVGISAWLTNAPRCRFRIVSGTGDLPVLISYGRLADEGIMLVSVCNDFGFFKHQTIEPFITWSFSMKTAQE